MASWSTLPAEIKLQIWGDVAKDPRTPSGNNVNGGGVKIRCAGYSLVSREWHSFGVFTRKIFSRLTITQHDFDMLRSLDHGQHKFIKYLWLRIELQKYTCDHCTEPEDAQWHGTNTVIVEQAIKDFFGIISAWSDSQGGVPEDVTLEISIHSPSDREHHFKPFDFDAVPVPELPSCDTATAPASGPSVDTSHPIWQAGANSVRRLFGRSALDARWDGPLLPAYFITGFVIRRQTRRRLSPLAACCILQALPNLQIVSVEFWREFTKVEQDMADSGHKHILDYVLPDSLRSLRLFEDFNEDIIHIFELEKLERREDPILGFNSFRIPNRAVASALARRSQGFENLAASLVVDAYDFFSATADACWAWNKLGSLSMTSEALGRIGWEKQMNEMLLMASAALKKMPKLRILEIWTGWLGAASLFRYEVDEGGATLTWKYGRDIHLDNDAVKAWEEAVLEHCGQVLRVDCETVEVDDILSLGHAISRLGLKIPVLDLESEKQIRLEGEVTIM